MHIHTRRGKLVYPTEDRDARPASQPDVRCTGGVPCQYGCSDLRVGVTYTLTHVPWNKKKSWFNHIRQCMSDTSKQ
eukprot:269292-Pelagomonas_calceolata.AAC.3